jgi:hypothetical protein
MRTQKTPDWKRQKTGLRAGPANGCELVDAARSGSTQIWRNDSAFLLRINPLPLHNFQTAGIVVADSYSGAVLVLCLNHLQLRGRALQLVISSVLAQQARMAEGSSLGDDRLLKSYLCFIVKQGC